MAQALALTSSQIALVRRTVAKDANETEFDLYIEMCRTRGLNPLLKHCYCFVFHKGDPKKRQMVIVVSVDGQRHLAERTGQYRPDDRPPRYETRPVTDEDRATNPAGLISAEVSVYKHSHGAWYPVPAVAYWDEAAPLTEIWDAGAPTGKFRLDPKKDGWRKMPRLMLAKVAEMAALRKAFPDDFSGLYGEEELDRGEVLDLSPSEIADSAEQKARLELIGGGGQSLTIDWMDGNELQRVPVGKFHDAAMAYLRTCRANPASATAWKERNRHALREFWALDKPAALDLNKKLEEIAAMKVIEAQVDEPKDAKPEEGKAPA